MGLLYEKLLRPVLFLQDAEKAHDLGVNLLGILSRMPALCRLMEVANSVPRTQPIQLFGLSFPNAVGLAAGMDKNGKCFPAAAALGFGHVEIGTVTAQRQPGNPRPRIFRYPNHEAIVNRMGFNNDGSEAVADRLKALGGGQRRRIPLGINIGKTRTVPIEAAVDDYLTSFSRLSPFADYITVNVSSPNTPELRKLQGADHLPLLLGSLCQTNRARARKLGTKPLPILLKIAPDLRFPEIDSILATALELKLDGIIATNTTVDRPPAVASSIKEAGGLSGPPLHSRALQIVRYIAQSTRGSLPVIGCGGVRDTVSAARLMDAGASLVQVYTGMVFHGPFFARDIARSLAPRHSPWIA